MFLGLPDPDPLVGDTDQAPIPEPSIIKPKSRACPCTCNNYYCSISSLWRGSGSEHNRRQSIEKESKKEHKLLNNVLAPTYLGTTDGFPMIPYSPLISYSQTGNVFTCHPINKAVFAYNNFFVAVNLHRLFFCVCKIDAIFGFTARKLGLAL